ncbi:MAG: hypothetical protein ACJ76Z_12280 [Thermoleophilaceae bacterium]
MRRFVTVPAALAVGMTLAGCGSSGTGATTAGTGSPSQGASSTSSTASATPTPRTAAQVVRALVARVNAAKLTVVYNASTDPNHLLGRPAGYTSKASWRDSRVKDPQDTEKGVVDLGGSVELYDDPADARKRADYIHSAEDSVGFLAHEYLWVSGGAVLRVSASLTPSQAKQYVLALAAVRGGTPVAVK